MAPHRKTSAQTSLPSRRQATLSFAGKNGQITKSSSLQTAKLKKDPSLYEDISTNDVKSEPDSDREISATPTGPLKNSEEAAVKAFDAAPDPLQSDGVALKTEDVLGGRAEQSETGAVGGESGFGWVSDEERIARKIPQTQINRYWRAKEQERKAPRVHQKGLSVHEKILREWDMSGQYGPCIGIARLKRWKRANMLGLSPPIEVLAVLLKEMDSGETNSQKAHVDELMSARIVED